MTAKIIKGASFSGAIGYMLSKEKAEILKAEGVRIEPKNLRRKVLSYKRQCTQP